jgi:branched-chain amino acid transport system permease protein
MHFLIEYKEYFFHLIILILIYSILAQSFNLSFGLSRLFNLAHIASYSIGAYASALCSTKLLLPFSQCIIVSVLTATLFSIAIGGIASRLANNYFAIGTMAFSALVSALLINWHELTNGVLGISGIPRPEIFSIVFEDNSVFLLLALAVILFAQLLLWILFRNHFGRKLKAIGEQEIAAKSLGINTKFYKNMGLVVASFFAGLSGCLFAYYINYIDPSSFQFSESVFILSIVVIGRPGSFWGVLLATTFLVLLPEPLRFIDLSEWWSGWTGVLGPVRQLIQAIILFLVVYWQRENLFPLERKI